MNKIIKKEVIIIGAGASYAAAELPLGNELGWMYYFQCSNHDRLENGKVAKDDLIKKSAEFATFEEFLDIAVTVYPELKNERDAYYNGRKKGIILFPYNIIEQKKYFCDEILSVLQKRNDIESVNKIKRVIFSHIADKSVDFRGGNNIYHILLQKKLDSDVHIISLNFDALISEDFKNGVGIDYSIVFDRRLSDRSYNRYEKCFPVLKLHGSVDWFWCKKCNKMYLLGPWVRSREISQRFCMECKSRIEPFVIVPHENKEVFNSQLNSLWEKAGNVLNDADEILFIGYSIPEYDIKIKELFKKHINLNSIIKIVDPNNVNIKDHLKGLLPDLNSDKIILEEKDFRYFANNLNHLTPNLRGS